MVLVAIVVVVIWVRASGSAEDDFLTAWGRTHKLEFVESADLGNGTPLLRQGDQRAAGTASSASPTGVPSRLPLHLHRDHHDDRRPGRDDP